MNRNVENTDMFRRAKKLTKRIAITILCCIPVMLIFAYLTRNVITNDAAQVVCFIAIMGAAIGVVEPIARAKEKKKKEQLKEEPKSDVFR